MAGARNERAVGWVLGPVRVRVVRVRVRVRDEMLSFPLSAESSVSSSSLLELFPLLESSAEYRLLRDRRGRVGIRLRTDCFVSVSSSLLSLSDVPTTCTASSSSSSSSSSSLLVVWPTIDRGPRKRGERRTGLGGTFPSVSTSRVDRRGVRRTGDTDVESFRRSERDGRIVAVISSCFWFCCSPSLEELNPDVEPDENAVVSSSRRTPRSCVVAGDTVRRTVGRDSNKC